MRKSSIIQKCLDCKKEFYVQLCRVKTAKYCSCECYQKNWTGYLYGVRIKKGQHFSPSTEFRKGHKGDKLENHPQWKGDNIGYNGLHTWLRTVFGWPNKCENKDCGHKSMKYEWALIKGKRYERKRENFWQLCVSCHRLYDGNSRRKK